MFATKKLTKERGEFLSTWYFRGGFAFLPWLWIANVLMFWRYRGNSDIIDSNVKRSGIAALVVFPALFIWYAVLYTQYPNSLLWIIRPGVPDQNGFFSDIVYNNL
jgi:hypothetical protein